MGKLDEAIMYLAGPMEYAPDNGVGWRRKFVKLAMEAGLKIYFIDPTNKPGRLYGNAEDRDVQTRMKKEGRYQELRDYVHKYRRDDLRFCDFLDAAVVVIDPKIPSWGTANEVYVSETEHKPMLVICEGGLANLPNWLFDVFDLDLVFSSIEEVIAELVKLNNGEKPLDDRWVLIRQHLSMLRYWDNPEAAALVMAEEVV
jgi:hypothetical protein